MHWTVSARRAACRRENEYCCCAEERGGNREGTKHLSPFIAVRAASFRLTTHLRAWL
jgi:hypothetical protein